MTEDLDTGASPEPVAAPEAPSTPSASPREALERAYRDMGGDRDEPQEREQATEAAEKPASGPARGPDGKFAPKATEVASEEDAAPAPASEPQQATSPQDDWKAAPQRFNATAKAEWEKAPLAIRGEVSRTIRELEGGIEKYRGQVEPLRPFLERAGDPGRLAQALTNYTQAEEMLARDPLQGLDLICRNIGLDLKQVAAHVMGQPAPERDAVIDGLRQELAGLKQQVGTVHQTFEQQRTQQTAAQVTEFAKAHPRFDELAGDIAQMLKTGYVDPKAPDALQRAYEMADRLKPVPQPTAPQTRETTPPQPAPQTRKSEYSVNGAPSSGSNPVRQRSATAGEAIQRAAREHGLI